MLLKQFRAAALPGGKVLVIDEAHKFLNGDKADGLSRAIVNAVRLMRHDGMRVIVSTQSPKVHGACWRRWCRGVQLTTMTPLALVLAGARPRAARARNNRTDPPISLA